MSGTPGKNIWGDGIGTALFLSNLESRKYGCFAILADAQAFRLQRGQIYFGFEVDEKPAAVRH